MTANQEIIAELRRVLGERDEARTKLEQCEKTKNGYAEQLDALSTAITDVLVKRIEPRLSRHPVTVVQHAGSVIDSIARAMGSEYDDGDDLIECVRLLVRECAARRARCDTLADNHDRCVEELALLREQLAAKHSECPDCADYAARSGRFAEQADRLQRERDEARAELKMVREGCDGWLEKCEQLSKERDEARAEVEMLRGVGCCEDGDGPCGVCRKCAYRRGAEAMREVAIQACLRVSISESYYAPNVGDECADAVRALPIPEEP